ncbi:MAG: pyridoxamine 5'-phosphate oxidase family protein [Candidatus Wallbacteria bacterium]
MKKNNVPALNQVYEYIDSFNVMTISTYCEKNKFPHATPVFFARSGNLFFFLSFETTQHGSNIVSNSNVCASITGNYKKYNEIKGVLIKGACEKIDISMIPGAMMTYFLKFNDIKSVINAENLKHAFEISWYKIEAKNIIYTDNSIKFGHKEIYDL